MKKYLLNLEDDELWRKVKSRCALIDITIQDLIVGFLEQWIEREEKRDEKKREKKRERDSLS